jgi:hypothetical protein
MPPLPGGRLASANYISLDLSDDDWLLTQLLLDKNVSLPFEQIPLRFTAECQMKSISSNNARRAQCAS